MSCASMRRLSNYQHHIHNEKKEKRKKEAYTEKNVISIW
jgi:hypothetical protein